MAVEICVGKVVSGIIWSLDDSVNEILKTKQNKTKNIEFNNSEQ